MVLTAQAALFAEDVRAGAAEVVFDGVLTVLKGMLRTYIGVFRMF